jgi:uncharacterized protein YqjF (DUF2071 family)
MASTFHTAEWRKLIMAQYAIDPGILLPKLPPGIELDLYKGACYVSLVGFLFDKVRIKGIPILLHTRFTEVNLRYYVRRTLDDGSVRRGVVFLSEIVPRPAITFVARTLYGEPYRTAPMKWNWRASSTEMDIGYSWKIPGKRNSKWQHLNALAEPQSQPMAEGSFEEFLTEHYWGYTHRRDGRTGEYGVEHPRWLCYPVREAHISVDFGALYGRPFAALTQHEPQHVLLADGSPIVVRKGEVF